MTTREQLGLLGKPTLLGWVVGVVVAMQILIPAAALVGDRPNRFGFQMYSAQGYVIVTAIDAQGSDVPLDLSTIVAGNLRPELNWTEVLPEPICAAFPKASLVTVKQPRQQRILACN